MPIGPFSFSARGIASWALATSRSEDVIGGIGFGFTDIDGSDTNGLFGAADFTGEVEKTSNFYSLEGNVGYQLSDSPVVVFAGLRYLRISDGLDALISSEDLGAASNRYKVDAENDLFGGQIGVKLDIPTNSSRWSGFAAASVGYYATSARVKAGNSGLVLGTSAPGDILNEGSASDSFGTFGADLHIAGAYHIDENKSIELGYSLMYFDRVASALPSYSQTNSGSTGVDPTAAVGIDSAVYHGLSIGFKMKF